MTEKQLVLTLCWICCGYQSDLPTPTLSQEKEQWKLNKCNFQVIVLLLNEMFAEGTRKSLTFLSERLLRRVSEEYKSVSDFTWIYFSRAVMS